MLLVGADLFYRGNIFAKNLTLIFCVSVHKYDNSFVSAVAEVRQYFSYTQVCKKVVFICVIDDDSYFQLF